MSSLKKSLLVLSVSLFLGSAFAGCFGDGGQDVRAQETEPKTHDIQLFLHQTMFHPAPGIMLGAWAFSENAQGSTWPEVPTIRVTEGDTVRITFLNTFDFNHTIHWHGLWVPWEMDGVPYLTQDPIEPGEQFTYEFEAKPAGTHMFHCHIDTPHHVDMGMYGILIVEPREEKYPYDSEATLVLDDWDSSHLHQGGTGGSDPQMTADSTTDDSGDPFNQLDRTESQVRDTYNNPQYPVVKDYYQNPSRAERDWYPVTYAPWQPDYDTFTINGRSFPLTEPVMIKENETKKVRLANIGNTIFSMHLHGHGFKVTHKDGFPLDSPYMADTLPIHPGERYEIMIEGNNPGLWMFHDHMGLHAMNQNIYPGGAATMLAYEGFAENLEGHDGHDHGGAGFRAGDFLGLYK